MKKRVVVIAAAAALFLLVLCSCGREKTLEEGRYALSSFKSNGWNMADIWKGSYINVSGVDDNSLSSIRLYMDASEGLYLDTFTGYLETQSTSNENITYRFWVLTHTGELFTNESQYISLRYYPDGKKIEMMGQDMTWIFSKD